MQPLSKLARVLVLTGCVASTIVGIALVAVPGIATSLSGATPEPRHVVTAFGVAALLGVATVLLRVARPSAVQYHAVRFHEPTEIRRPTPLKLRPKVSAKVRTRVRDDAAQRVREATKRKPR